MDTLIKILEDSPNITGDYDRTADILYISLGETSSAIAIELGEGIIARYNEQTNTIVGITVIGLREKVLKELNRKLHVVFEQDMWIVKEETVPESVKKFPSQEAALKYAIGIAKTQWLEVVIHDEDGEIKEVINPAMDALLERRHNRENNSSRKAEIAENAAETLAAMKSKTAKRGTLADLKTDLLSEE